MKPRASHRGLRDDSGAVYVEFLVAIVPVLVLFLGLIQLSLMYVAQLVVQHSAILAARAAVVVLDDDPAKYGDEGSEENGESVAPEFPRGMVLYEGSDGGDGDGSSSSGANGALSEQLGLDGSFADLGFESSSGGPRLNAIRRAAYMPLSVLAPSLVTLTKAFHLDVGIERLGNGGRFLGGMLLYNRAAAMITLRDAAGEVTDSVPSDGDVTVRVTYFYNCGIPFVRTIMCDSVADLTGLTTAINAVTDVYDAIRDGRYRDAIESGQALQDELEAAEDEFDDLQAEMKYAQNPNLIIPFAFANGRFLLLRAEATLRNQGACYYAGSTCAPEGD